MFRHRPAADQVFADDAVHHGIGDAVVPGAVGLHAQDRAALAGCEAGGAGAFDAHLAIVESGRLELVAEAVEEGLGNAVGGAARAGAQQQVAAVGADFRFDDFAHASISSVQVLSAASGSASRAAM